LCDLRSFSRSAQFKHNRSGSSPCAAPSLVPSTERHRTGLLSPSRCHPVAGYIFCLRSICFWLAADSCVAFIFPSHNTVHRASNFRLPAFLFCSRESAVVPILCAPSGLCARLLAVLWLPSLSLKTSIFAWISMWIVTGSYQYSSGVTRSKDLRFFRTN
jgi:hypothetical protein